MPARDQLGRRTGFATKLGAAVIAAAFIAATFYFAFSQLRYHWNWDAIYTYRESLLKGWRVTVAISVASLLLSTLIGVIFALIRRSPLLPLRYFGQIYVEVIRGTPLLVQILILYYVFGATIHVSPRYDRYVAGVLILSCFSGAYMSEIIRAGIESVGESQLESARAIG